MGRRTYAGGRGLGPGAGRGLGPERGLRLGPGRGTGRGFGVNTISDKEAAIIREKCKEAIVKKLKNKK